MSNLSSSNKRAGKTPLQRHFLASLPHLKLVKSASAIAILLSIIFLNYVFGGTGTITTFSDGDVGGIITNYSFKNISTFITLNSFTFRVYPNEGGYMNTYRQNRANVTEGDLYATYGNYSYSCSDCTGNNFSRMVDGNVATAGGAQAGPVYSGEMTIWMNYTIPINKRYQATMNQKANHCSACDYNFTVLDECLYQGMGGTLQTVIEFDYIPGNMQCQTFCYNSTTWKSIVTNNPCGQVNETYIFWNLTTIPDFTFHIGDIKTYSKTQLYNYITFENSSTINTISYNNCTCTGCSYSSGYCSIPIQMNSSILGNVTMNNITGNYSFGFDNCTLSNVPSVNYTIIDEVSGGRVTATATGIFNYSVAGFSDQYSLSAVNTNNFTMCIRPNMTRLEVTVPLYVSSTYYPQRRFYQTYTASNSTQVFYLPLLNSSLGIYARFRTVDAYSNIIGGVNGKMYKASNLSLIVEEEEGDSAGLLTFFANPDTDYYFVFSKSGYPTQTMTLRPTSADIYTVVMSGTVNLTNISMMQGLRYTFLPSSGSPIEVGESYPYTVDFRSSYYSITYCRFYMVYGGNLSFLREGTTAYTASLCTGNISYTASDEWNIATRINVVLDDKYNLTFDPIYAPFNRSLISNFTIMTIVDDINNFTGAGFNAGSRVIIGFIIVVGIMLYISNRFSAIMNPVPFVFVMVVLVWLISLFGWFAISDSATDTLQSMNESAQQIGDTAPAQSFTFIEKYSVAMVITMMGVTFYLIRVRG